MLKDFQPQSLLDVQDTLVLFGALPAPPNPLERRLGLFYEDHICRHRVFPSAFSRHDRRLKGEGFEPNSD